MVPYDTMHVELDGLVRQELAFLLYILVTKRKYFSLEKLNEAIKKFPWPAGQRMPEIDPKVWPHSSHLLHLTLPHPPGRWTLTYPWTLTLDPGP